ncbi:unnamed protein product, partial [Oppiella nova]
MSLWLAEHRQERQEFSATRLAIKHKDQTLLATVFTHLLFFDPNQQLPPFFGGQPSGPPQQHFFNPQQFLVQPNQQFNGQPPQAQPQLAQSQPSQPQLQAQPPAPQGPQINWGKCPQLEPSEKEKSTKAQVITKCLETTPLPPNITRD